MVKEIFVDKNFKEFKRVPKDDIQPVTKREIVKIIKKETSPKIFAEDWDGSTDCITRYIKEQAIQNPLLTLEEEKELGERIQKGLKIKDISQPKNFDNVILNENAKEAFDILVEHNLKLVISRAKRFIYRGLFFLDLIQDGNEGLMDAAVKFEPGYNLAFSTYAVWWIDQRITRAISNYGRTIRIPVHVAEEYYTIRQHIDSFTKKNGRKPTIGELAVHTELSEEYIEKILGKIPRMYSLNASVNEDDGDSEELGDFLPAQGETAQELSEDNERRRLVITAMKTVLNERELYVILLRHGFIDGTPLTLDEVGKKFQVTRERIRQIEGNAITKLRHYKWKKLLSDFVERRVHTSTEDDA